MKRIESSPCRLRSGDVLTAEIYDTVDPTDAGEWKGIAARNVFLSRGYLRALESGFAPIYTALFRLKGRPVGAAFFQTAVFRGAPLGGYLQYQCRVYALFTRSIKFIRESFDSRMLVCGSPFTSGEHGFAFLDEVGDEAAALGLVRAAQAVSLDLEQRGTSVDGILFKEFTPRTRELAGRLGQTRFTTLTTDPAMVLYLDTGWHSFNDYLDSLSSKYRVKANREFAKSKALETRDLLVGDVVAMRESIDALYRAVAERADYRLGDLPANALAAMRVEMKDDFILRGYFLAGHLVGFLTGFVNGNVLEAGLVGFDYTLNRQHAIYPRMLYDYLRIALDRELSTVNYGRTASEIKSTLGAVPVYLSCCLRLQKSALNSVLPLLSGAVRPKPFAWRRPFKQSWYEQNIGGLRPGIFAAVEKHSYQADLQGRPA